MGIFEDIGLNLLDGCYCFTLRKYCNEHCFYFEQQTFIKTDCCFKVCLEHFCVCCKKLHFSSNTIKILLKLQVTTNVLS